MHGKLGCRIVLQSVAKKARAKVRPADADIHDVLKWSAARAVTLSLADRFAESLEGLLSGVVANECFFSDAGVPNGSLLGQVDGLTLKHPLPEAVKG